MVAYQPVSSSSSAGHPCIICSQHHQYFGSLVDHCSPETIFVKHLIEAIATWVHSRDEVLLLIYMNKCVYQGYLSQHVGADGIVMQERCTTVFGFESPIPHHRGKLLITGFFVTSNVNRAHVIWLLKEEALVITILL